VPAFRAEDFCRLFGVKDLPAACARLVEGRDFSYEIPRQEDIARRVEDHIASDRPTKVGEHRADIWESCWSENLDKFRQGGFDPEKLVPDFIKPGQPMRFNRQYILPASDRFELEFFQVCRAFLFERYFRDAGAIYEFGCGSGFNLLAAAQQFPGKRLCGLDWSRSSNEMLNTAGQKLGLPITGRHFDFFHPDRSLEVTPQTAVLTMCALEQVGPRHKPFIDFLLEKKPMVVLNMEPMLELYDEANAVDALAIRFHRKRGYLEGLLPSLKQLEAERRIEILELKRFQFGSLYHECYSYVAWRTR
jgi:SAM-dependent methyltransferase